MQWELLHQQSLTGTFGHPAEFPLVVGWQPSVFARQQAPLIRYELPEQVVVLEIERIDGEIDLRFGAGTGFSVGRTGTSPAAAI